MEIPVKYLYDFANNRLVDSNNQEVATDGEKLQAVLGSQPIINIQLVDSDGNDYIGLEATTTAQMLVDSDFINAPVPIPMGNDSWTNTTGNEYSKALSVTPATVYFDSVLATEGTKGSLAVSEWAYDATTEELHVRLSDDTTPGTVALSDTGWTNTVGNEYKKSVAFEPSTVWFNDIEATEGTEGSLAQSEWVYDTAADELHVRLADDASPGSKASGWVDAEHNDNYVTVKMSVSDPTTPYIECYASDFNQAGTWYNTSTQTFETPDIEDGEITFRLNANTANYYIRIGTTEKSDATAEIQFFNASDELITIKKMNFICWNRIYGSTTTPLDIAPSNYYTKTETDSQIAASTGSFTALTDTPANYTSKGSFLVRVNAGANAIEFVDNDNYLLADGTQAMTANWDVGNFTITANGLTLDGTFTDGTTSIAGGNYTGVGNITGTDIDIAAGTGDYTTSGKGSFGDLDVDTLNLNGNVISDSTGAISFDDEDLTTTGNFTAASISANVDIFVNSDSGALFLGDGQDVSIYHNGTDWRFDILQTTGVVAFNPDGDDTDFVYGSSQLDDTGASAQDARMWFDKGKGAFRAGKVLSTQWDAANVGDYSAAFGYNNTASGDYAAALGFSSTASGLGATAMGNSTASGGYSSALGFGVTASGDYSVALGYGTVASGNYSIAIGKSFTNSTVDSFAVGFGQKDFEVKSGEANVIGILTVGDGGSTNYAHFAADGELNLHGTARVTKRITMAACDYGHGGTPPDSTVVGNYHVWSYDISDDSALAFELPPDWASGTDITVSVDWAINEAYAAANAQIQWNVTWSAVPHDGTEALDAPTHSGTLDPGDMDIPSTAKTLDRTELGTISGASLTAGDEIGMNLERVAIDSGNNPTADPFVIHLTIEYIADKLGEAT